MVRVCVCVCGKGGGFESKDTGGWGGCNLMLETAGKHSGALIVESLNVSYVPTDDIIDQSSISACPLLFRTGSDFFNIQSNDFTSRCMNCPNQRNMNNRSPSNSLGPRSTLVPEVFYNPPWRVRIEPPSGDT